MMTDESTISMTEGLKSCQFHSEAIIESCRQLDQLVARIRREAEGEYRSRRQMDLKSAAAGGDHTEATSLWTSIVEVMAWSGALTRQLRELSRDGRID